MGHVPCTHDGTDMPACTPDLMHAHVLPNDLKKATTDDEGRKLTKLIDLDRALHDVAGET